MYLLYYYILYLILSRLVNRFESKFERGRKILFTEKYKERESLFLREENRNIEKICCLKFMGKTIF